MKYDEKLKGSWALKITFENGKFSYMINLKSGLTDAQLEDAVENYCQPLYIAKIIQWEYLPYEDIFKN